MIYVNHLILQIGGKYLEISSQLRFVC